MLGAKGEREATPFRSRSGNAALGDIRCCPGALGGCTLQQAASPQRLTDLIVCSPGNPPSPPGDISLVYKWDLLIFCDFPGLSFALPALQSGFAWFPAHTHTHAHTPMHAQTSLLVSFQIALSASHNFCSLQFRSLLNETHAGLSNHNVIYNLPQNTFIQLVAHWRKRTPYELAAEALI